MKDKIVFLSLHPGFGGAASANANIINTLTLNNKVQFIDEYIESTAVHLNQDDNNLSIISYPIGTNKYYPWRIIKLLRKSNPDKIIVGFPFLLIFYWPVFLIFRMKGCKIISVFHSLTIGETIKSKVIDILLSFSLLVCNHLIFVSQYTKRSWNKFPWVQVCDQQVIYNTTEKPLQIKQPDSVKIIAFIGRLSDEKQPEIFCSLARKSKIEKLPYKYILWGDGPLGEQLKARYSDCVEFNGVTHHIEQMYSVIDLLIMTSKFENCPMVVIESKARGIPAICPNVGGISEIISNNVDGILVSNLSLNILVESIKKIDNNYIYYSKNCIEQSIRLLTINNIQKWQDALE